MIDFNTPRPSWVASVIRLAGIRKSPIKSSTGWLANRPPGEPSLINSPICLIHSSLYSASDFSIIRQHVCVLDVSLFLLPLNLHVYISLHHFGIFEHRCYIDLSDRFVNKLYCVFDTFSARALNLQSLDWWPLQWMCMLFGRTWFFLVPPIFFATSLSVELWWFVELIWDPCWYSQCSSTIVFKMHFR